MDFSQISPFQGFVHSASYKHYEVFKRVLKNAAKDYQIGTQINF